ncbi:electron transport complex subunit RsxD [Pokkaliibacter sp. CJK22405]|uniref:electron transport complex subunit RsxD n=1 Tax=Pokkaliibacter sp. CJK22405 TaxID=3384615 RepID=UPI00398554E1
MINSTSPFTRQQLSTAQVMQAVMIAMVPGIATLIWMFGWGSLVQIALGTLTALLCEGIIMYLRKRPVSFYLKDSSALVTAWLLALSIPPYAPWWLIVIGTAFSIIFAKQIYGGLGYNPFNPAMVGYALLLVALPVPMTQWTTPATAMTSPDFMTGLHYIFEGSLLLPDAITSATPLDVVRHKGATSIAELWQQNTSLVSIWPAWIWLSLAWVLGGLYMLYRRIITWHIPVALVASLAITSGVYYLMNPGHHASPVFHLMAGATMFGAFFIATDPVTAATSNKGKLIYGAGIGVLLFVIRTWGNYPDAIAFSVLLMNLAAPFLDYYTQPRTYGHRRAKRGLPKKS